MEKELFDDGWEICRVYRMQRQDKSQQMTGDSELQTFNSSSMEVGKYSLNDIFLPERKIVISSCRCFVIRIESLVVVVFTNN